MINWPDLKLPPINLWSVPRQNNVNEEIKALQLNISQMKTIKRKAKIRIEHQKDMLDMYERIELNAEQKLKELKELEFIYYCRTGRFPE